LLAIQLHTFCFLQAPQAVIFRVIPGKTSRTASSFAGSETLEDGKVSDPSSVQFRLRFAIMSILATSQRIEV
jgi:hypothetical protein